MSIITNSLLINKNEERISDVISVYNNSMNESYFFSSLRFLSECKDELRSSSKDLYKSILESNNNLSIINESFSSFIAKAKEIIDKFIEYIKSMFARFITFLNSIVKSDKYLKNHKKDFSKFISDNEFEFDGYVFTITSDVPLTAALAKWEQDFIELTFDKKDDNGKIEEFGTYIKNLYTDLSNRLESTFYDEFRAEVIKNENPISSNDYSDELFTKFRNGSSDKESITITSSYLNSAYDRFEKYDKSKNDASKIQKELEKEYKNIKKSIEDLVSKTEEKTYSFTGKYKGDSYRDAQSISIENADAVNTMNNFIKLKVEQINQMSTIHIMAFAAKLDAMKDCFVQDKTVLYKALNRIQSVKKGDR